MITRYRNPVHPLLRIVFGAALLLLLVATARAEILPNSLSARLGYHSFLSGQTFKSGGYQADLSATDLSGVSGEIEYRRRFHDVFSLAVSTCLYGGETHFADTSQGADLEGSWTVLVWPILVTPRLHLPVGPVDLYTGGGGGIYFFQTDFRVKVDAEDGSEDIHQTDFRNRFGWHLLLGVDWQIHRSWSLLIEDRFAFAPFNGGLRGSGVENFDAGGNTLFIGARWHF